MAGQRSPRERNEVSRNFQLPPLTRSPEAYQAMEAAEFPSQ